jgi:BTB/POZ domain
VSSAQSSFNDTALIHSRVILYSETVEIFAGNQQQQKQTFVVHKDLLTLHSLYFTRLFSDKGLGGDKKIAIAAKPSLFADFVAWIYFGEFLEVENDALDGGTTVDDLWELGRFFGAPGFQNFCMDDCRTYCKGSDTNPARFPWPFVKGIKQMYATTPRGSRLRALARDSLSYKNPLQENKKGSAVWKEWRALLTGQSSKESWVNDLREDFALEVGKDWKGVAPVSAFYHCTSPALKTVVQTGQMLPGPMVSIDQALLTGMLTVGRPTQEGLHGRRNTAGETLGNADIGN